VVPRTSAILPSRNALAVLMYGEGLLTSLLSYKPDPSVGRTRHYEGDEFVSFWQRFGANSHAPVRTTRFTRQHEGARRLFFADSRSR
jgi:hypothetical protein